MVEFIEYKKEKLPICVNFHALAQIEKEGLELGSENNTEAMLRLFWHSLVAGYFYEGKDLDIKEEHATFVFGACFEQFENVLSLFLASRTQAKPKKPTVKERLKKQA